MFQPGNWVAWQLAQLGICESPPQSNNQKYGQYVHEDDVAWCAIEQACAFLMNGVNLDYWSAGCAEWAREAESHGDWHTSMDLHVPAIIVIRSWQGLSLHDPNLDPEQMHAQGILSVSGSALNLIGGNQNDPSGGIVSRDTVTIGDRTICGVIDTRKYFGKAPVVPTVKPTPAQKLPASPSHASAKPMLYLGQPDTSQDRVWTTKVQQHVAPKNVIDGVFGPKTFTAVEDFQKGKKLTVDGCVGPKTYAAMGL